MTTNPIDPLDPKPSFERRRSLLRSAAVATLGAGLATVGLAQPASTWPTRTLRILVPYPAGGSTDLLTRLVAQALGDHLGQSVVVENKGGAGGSVGAASFVNSGADDHYFLMVTPSQLSINQYLYKSNLGYDPERDLTPVGLTAQTTNVVVVPPSMPVNSLAELIEYCKKNPGKVAYSSAGVGSTGHLLNELLKATVGIDVLHVPYKGNGPSMLAVVSGEVQFNTDNMPQLLPQIRGGKVRPLAVTSAKRWFQLPDVPTVAELGLPTLTTMVWFGLVAQSSTTTATIQRMNAALQHVLSQPELAAKLRETSLEATPGPSREMAALAESERARWKSVVERSGARIE